MFACCYLVYPVLSLMEACCLLVDTWFTGAFSLMEACCFLVGIWLTRCYRGAGNRLLLNVKPVVFH